MCFFLSNGEVWCVIWISHDLSLFFLFVFEKNTRRKWLLPTGDFHPPLLQPSRPFPPICQELIACQKSKALEMASGRSKAGVVAHVEGEMIQQTNQEGWKENVPSWGCISFKRKRCLKNSGMKLDDFLLPNLLPLGWCSFYLWPQCSKESMGICFLVQASQRLLYTILAQEV